MEWVGLWWDKGTSNLRSVIEEAVAVRADVPVANRGHPEGFYVYGVVGCKVERWVELVRFVL
jgi:hypothetical protein